MTNLLIAQIAVACSIVGTVMLLAAIVLAIKMTYPPKEVE